MYILNKKKSFDAIVVNCYINYYRKTVNAKVINLHKLCVRKSILLRSLVAYIYMYTFLT